MILEFLGDEDLLFRLTLLELITAHGAAGELLPAPSRRFTWREDPPQDEFTTLRYFLARGAGDCDNSAPYLAAWCRQQATPAAVVLVLRRGALHAATLIGSRGAGWLDPRGARLVESTWIFQQSKVPDWYELTVSAPHRAELAAQLAAVQQCGGFGRG